MVLTQTTEQTALWECKIEGIERSNFIQWPADPPDRATMGGKAATLAALGQAFPIPAWFVITPAALLASLSADQRIALAQGQALGVLQLNPAVAVAINQALTALDPAPSALFAVRSSAIGEDGETASFAGQLASFLQVRRAQIGEQVCAVWQSAFAQHVGIYQARLTAAYQHAACNNQLPAVIVQRMVDADVAGVAFGADPVSGDRTRCMITATLGLADQLVSGAVNGDTYTVDRSGTVLHQQVVEPTALLAPATIRALVMLLTQVEAQRGAPQDIEWALEDGRLYLLQARPITTLPPCNDQGTPTQPPPGWGRSRQGSLPKLGRVREGLVVTPPVQIPINKTQGQPTIWDNSNIVESYSGVTSPLTFSFARHVYAEVYIEFCQQMGVAPAKIAAADHAFHNLLGYVNGHVYYNLLNWYRILALFPGFRLNRRFMEQMMGVKEPLAAEMVAQLFPTPPTRWQRFVDGLQLARAGLGLLGSQLTLKGAIKRFYSRLDHALSRPTAQLQQLSLVELAAAYRTIEQQLLTKWDAPLVNDFLCMIAFGLSRKLLAGQAGEAGLQLHSELLIGQGDIISAEPARRIQQMATLAAQAPNLIEILCHDTVEAAVAALAAYPALQAEYEAYLAKFGNRCFQELKLESPTLHDDPTTLLRAIGQLAKRYATIAPTNQAKAAQPTTVAQALIPLFPGHPLRRWLAGHLVQWAKARVRDRENLRFERTRVFGYARQIFLAMGERLCTAGLIDDPKSIFLLAVSEVMAVIDGATTTYDLRGLIALRKAEQAHFAALPAPPNRFTAHGLSFAAFKTEAYAVTATRPDAEQQHRQGIGCCAGVVCAPVRVIADPRQATLQPGEIMVARFTDPGWITLFANAAGILVERGSLLSHSAIVARELGIPAIVAIDGVMDWLQTGDVVEMDGATGVVKRKT